MASVTILAASLVLLSIDGLKPDYVLQADAHGLRIPNLRRLVEEGAYATAVRGVFPTVTYPSHATMLTGVSPERHGIVSNHPFDPFTKNQDGWYWYVEDLKALTLWEAVEKSGRKAASIDWPVSVGAPVSFNIVQYWRAGNAEDIKVIRALSTKGLLEEAEAVLGSYPGGNDYTIAADRRRTEFIEYVLEQKKPAFLTAYFSGLDTVEHATGPYSRETFDSLEILDELVGRLRAKAEVLAVVSDHGFVATKTEVHLNAALAEAGLIEVSDSGQVVDWKAISWDQGGSAMVMLKDPTDAGVRRQVAEILKGTQGVDPVTESEDRFLVGLAKGFRNGSSLKGPAVREGSFGGTHGYPPEVEEMSSAFFLAGEGVPRGLDLGRIDMRDIAPTLARILEVSLPDAEGGDVLKAP